jgi:DNA polymerase-1
MKRMKLKRGKRKTIPKRKQQITTLLVDLKYLAYRMRYTQGTKLTYEEVDTTIMFGVINSLLSAAKKFEINKCVICADVGSNEESRRREQYPEYKVKKYSQPLTQYDMELNTAFKEEYENLLEIFDDVGFGTNILPKYEADDLIALYCREHRDDEAIIIITRDEDMYQCIDSNVSVFSPDDKVVKDLIWFEKEYGISPADWKYVKAMAGCKSDNVKGIHRIGEETALKYLREEATDKQVTKIDDEEETVNLCMSVVELPHKDVENLDYEFTVSDVDVAKLVKFCRRYGFKSILDDLNGFADYFISY